MVTVLPRRPISGSAGAASRAIPLCVVAALGALLRMLEVRCAAVPAVVLDARLVRGLPVSSADPHLHAARHAGG
jgi:hypothetical protein